jgi:pimeloyl-ACP methyl ester carboxylesterase
MSDIMPIAKVNGININYTVEGHGEPLVMIMGLGGDQSAWKHQVSAFKKHYQVITFDNRGVGKSDKPKGSYSPTLMAEDTIQLMDFLEIKKAHILGMSMGGLIAQEVAINYPERILKLILASTFACWDNEANGPTPEMLAVAELPLKQGISRLLDASFNKFFNRFIMAPLIKLLTIRIKEAELTGLKGQIEGTKGYDSFNRLPLIKALTLVLAGTKDRVVKSSSSDTISQKIPNAKLVKIDNGSHLVCWEMSKVFNKEVLDFLKST